MAPVAGMPLEQVDHQLLSGPEAGSVGPASDVGEALSLGNGDAPQPDDGRVEGATQGRVGDGGQAPFQVVDIRQGGLIERPTGTGCPAEHRAEERFLAVEAGVEGRLGRACCLSDGIHRCGFVAVLQEQPQGTLPNLLVELGGFFEGRAATASGAALGAGRLGHGQGFCLLGENQTAWFSL